MYLAMNNFSVVADRSEEFETAWRERDSYLDGVPGFKSFHLLKGAEEDGILHYASHTVWADEASFRAWVDSDEFKKAHAQGRLGPILAGPPVFKGFRSVMEQ